MYIIIIIIIILQEVGVGRGNLSVDLITARLAHLVEVSEALDVGHRNRFVGRPERIDLLQQPLLHALITRDEVDDERERGGRCLRPRQQELKREPAHEARLQQPPRRLGALPRVQQQRQRIHAELPPWLPLPPLYELVQPLHQLRVARRLFPVRGASDSREHAPQRPLQHREQDARDGARRGAGVHAERGQWFHRTVDELLVGILIGCIAGSGSVVWFDCMVDELLVGILIGHIAGSGEWFDRTVDKFLVGVLIGSIVGSGSVVQKVELGAEGRLTDDVEGVAVEEAGDVDLLASVAVAEVGDEGVDDAREERREREHLLGVEEWQEDIAHSSPLGSSDAPWKRESNRIAQCWGFIFIALDPNVNPPLILSLFLLMLANIVSTDKPLTTVFDPQLGVHVSEAMKWLNYTTRLVLNKTL